MRNTLTGWQRAALCGATAFLAWQAWRRVGRGRRRDDTKRALGGSRGVFLRERVEVLAPVAALYRFWQNPANLPRVMPYLESVQPIDAVRSHWIVAGPVGSQLEWDAEVINQVPFETIGWQSLPGADVASAGSVRFRPIGSGRTDVTVTMQYEPPAGRVGASIASLLGPSPARRVREALLEFKRAMERDASAVRFAATAPAME
jgi:uncharacterized membrane protein